MNHCITEGVSRSKWCSGTQAIVLALLLVLACVCFWTLRIAYWHTTTEQPFSDMADYLNTAKQIECCGDFRHSEFWQSYMKPALPLLGAVVFKIVGSEELSVWRFALAAICFGGLGWLAWEIRKLTRSALLPILLLFIVACSKSSVFWSAKFATEGLAEALMYTSCAFYLFLSRRITISPAWYILFGALQMYAIYNRPNTSLVTLVIGISLLLRGIFSAPSFWRCITRNIPSTAAFGLGAMAVMIPWILRSYTLYGAVTLSPTQGPYSFLWELGDVTYVDESGKTIITNANALQAEAPTRFANDYEAMVYAKKVVRHWIRENWATMYPQLIRARFWTSIQERHINLSMVSRTTLYSSWVDRLVIDKTPWRLLLGVLGLALLAVRCGRGAYILCLSTVLPWIFGIFFLGDPRLGEPSLPLLLFGNVTLAYLIATSVVRMVEKRGGSTSKSRNNISANQVSRDEVSCCIE